MSKHRAVQSPTNTGGVAATSDVTRSHAGVVQPQPKASADTPRETTASARPASDFSALRTHGEMPADRSAGMAARVTSTPHAQGDPMIPRAIAATGAGTISTTYTPEAKDKSTKIVFIQVMRELLDGVPSLPSTLTPGTTYMDPDTTADFYHVDYFDGEKDAYYNGDDPSDIGTQGNAMSTPKVPASTSDTPGYADGIFPTGKSKMRWEFRTAALSAAGDDKGTYYGYADWLYAKEKAKAATTSVTGTSSGSPGNKFQAAVDLWNANHGSKVLGGIIGGLAIGAIGAGVGYALGGFGGAIAGGVIGGVAGAYLGSR
jgi:hypothetical protein